MKSLLILRHAKSSWDDPLLDDHDRPLSSRGRRNALQIGKLLRKNKLTPDLIISSTAKRAKATAQTVAKACRYQKKIEFSRDIYDGGLAAYSRIVRKIPDKFKRIMIVGHNPDLENLIYRISKEKEHFPTASLAYFKVAILSWQQFNLRTKAILENLWRPREL